MNDFESHGERLGALFLLGVALFNPLVVSLFDVGAETTLFGIPLLYLYLFAAWAVLIGLMALAVDAPSRGERRPDAGPEPPIETE